MLGAIVRADNSGLGVICEEVARHLNPDRVLIVDMGSLNRGGYFPERFEHCPEVYVTRPLFQPGPLNAFLAGLDTVFSAETFYDPRFEDYAAEHHVRRVLYAMVELHDPYRPEQRAEQTYLPAEYPGYEIPVLPWPVALDRLGQRAISSPAKRFFHLPAAAFHDRNGTELLLSALPHVQSEVTFVIGGGNGKREHRSWHVGNVTVEWGEQTPDNYWEVWPDDIDVFVLPRRYGNLSLPLWEAAALGLPVVSTCLAPQSEWFDSRLLCSVRDAYNVAMKGGTFAVHEPDALDLARRIDWLASDAVLAKECAAQNRAWAEARSWDVLGDQWREALGA